MEKVGFWRCTAAFLIDSVIIYVVANILFLVYVIANAENFQSDAQVTNAAETFEYVSWTLGWPYFATMEGFRWSAEMDPETWTAP
jgi:uncharacterized RDD family membrane protein YckC